MASQDTVPSPQSPPPPHSSTSHISTPPPTIESQTKPARARGTTTANMTPDELALASAESLRQSVLDLQAALHEANMSAAHHRLQYEMLSQESAAALERMQVEASMAQHESDVLRLTSTNKVAATTVPQQAVLPEGMIPVHRELYERMCGDIRSLQDAKRGWEREYAAQERVIGRQENEIASLSDKVTLMRERIRENREHVNKARGRSNTLQSTPRTLMYDGGTPQRSQGLEALLQASEMANPELRQHRKGHSRNTHSLSSLPATPQRSAHYPPGPAPMSTSLFNTPSGRQPPVKVPSTAPMPRTSAMRTPNHNIYAQPLHPITQKRGPQSEGTVSAEEETDNDSEAETDILDAIPGDEIAESQASRAAGLMLSRSQDLGVGLGSSGMLGSVSGGLKQSKLFGAVRKVGVERADGGPAAKRQRTGDGSGVGLGISGMRD